MNYFSYPYPSRRTVVMARRGMVATSQPLAAQAGLEMLQKGGNAIDAAVATAAALTVLEPTSNGIGGDAFAIVYHQGAIYGLNASGPAPEALTLEALQAYLKRYGLSHMPDVGWPAITVPGAPAAWAALVQRFGRLSLLDVLQPAIRYAEEGYPVSPRVSYDWVRAVKRYEKARTLPHIQDQAGVLDAWFDTFTIDGRAPQAGAWMRFPHHARTLQTIGETAGRAFYDGHLAELIDAESKTFGGWLRGDDLKQFAVEWVEPLRLHYRGYDVLELPPNGHGLVALMALGMLANGTWSERETVDTYHSAIEAVKLAYADARAHLADIQHMRYKPQDFLHPAYLRERYALIGARAHIRESGRPLAGGTVYLATADGEGNMVSYIQSNYMGFGSGVVIPKTGIALHNRGHNFSLEAGHPNVLAPGKRPYHTIIPGFLMKEGKPVGPFGVMGGFMQPQGHVQVVMNMIDFALNPQAALDAPRWQWLHGNQVALEYGVPRFVIEGLMERGHEVHVDMESGSFGRGQIIVRDPSGTLIGGSEPRADGGVAAW